MRTVLRVMVSVGGGELEKDDEKAQVLTIEKISFQLEALEKIEGEK